MSAAELNEDFIDMLSALRGAGVEFLIVGAHALAAHGIARATGDLDIFIKPSPTNATRVLTALSAFGAPTARISADDFANPGNVYQIGLPPRRIDLLTEISGVTYDEAASGRVVLSVAGHQVAFLGRAELIKNKRAAGRDKDLLDVAALERMP